MKIKELIVGEMCDITLVVKSAIAKKTRNEKPYLSIEFFDGVDSISGNYWDWASGNIPPANAILDVTAQVTEWQGTKQLNVKALKTNTTAHIADFMPSSGNDIAKIYNDAYALMSNVKDDTLRTIALAALEELRQQWLTVPGASGIHHAYVGGTLVHSYEAAVIAMNIALAVPEANTDLVIVGAMLHDIGKLFTYKLNGINIDRTPDGNLYEHIFMGAEFIGNFADSHVNTEDYKVGHKVRLLRHIILSHHGSLEYGSPVTPMCIEAYIVNHADGISATAEQIRVAARKAPENSMWTDRIYTLNNRAQLTPNYVEHVMSMPEEELVGE